MLYQKKKNYLIGDDIGQWGGWYLRDMCEPSRKGKSEFRLFIHYTIIEVYAHVIYTPREFGSLLSVQRWYRRSLLIWNLQ